MNNDKTNFRLKGDQVGVCGGGGISIMNIFAKANISGIIVATMYMGLADGVMLSIVSFNSALSDSEGNLAEQLH